ncbi:MAG: AAA family ATPase [Maritimibacter sp.]|nr:AAA family ATPase [Maritimibacter sp.]
MPATASTARIHITGAAGSGVSTLGRALAERLGLAYLDTDDAYWLPTDPRFTAKRPIPDRLAFIAEAQGAGGWVVAGSLCGWGDPAVRAADLIVFLTAPTPQRLARIRRRERAEFGERVAAGGDMERIHSEFLNWAAQYDDPHFTGRSRVMHEAWLMEQTAPVLRLDGGGKVEALVSKVLAALG